MLIEHSSHWGYDETETDYHENEELKIRVLWLLANDI
jgi:hypothetical protein